MNPATHHGLRWIARAGFAAMIALATPALGRAADFVRPWTPPTSDSLVMLASEARSRFRAAKGDSAHGENFEAYELVSRMGRRLLGALGRTNTLQAAQIEAVLDSMGLDTELAQDPSIPSIVLLMVRNPYRFSADAVGFLYWFRAADLRVQGSTYPPNHRVRLRTWWSARPGAPYEAAVLFDRRGERAEQGFRLLRMSADGFYWDLAQYDGPDFSLGPTGEASFADLNRDGRPELVTYTKLEPDSVFSVCSGCPGLQTERIWTERARGFVLHDQRAVPSPLATFMLFTRLLREGQRENASRLLVRPDRVAEALAQGWGAAKAKGAWALEYAEEGEPWPEWLALRLRSGAGPDRRYIVHFVLRDARWAIRDWTPVQPAGAARPGSPGRAPAKPPGGSK